MERRRPTGPGPATTTQATGVSGFGDFAVGPATPNPSISSLSPSWLGQGATTTTVTVNGSNFLSGAVVSITGTGLTVGATTFVNAGQLRFRSPWMADATTGARFLAGHEPELEHRDLDVHGERHADGHVAEPVE